MKEIPLTQGKVALVDDEDYERLAAMGKWCVDKDGYAIKGIRFRCTSGKSCVKIIRMHREILNFPEGLQVDHIDGNVLNNKKSNLRLCTNRENSMNQSKSKRSKNKFKGISIDKRTNRVYAQICVNGKRIHIGTFSDDIEAARAYNKAAAHYFGEFAKLNQI